MALTTMTIFTFTRLNHCEKTMYKVIHISSGIVAATFNERAFALDWLAENNNLLGEPANLYKIVKTIP